jgi:hypothetical protein
VKSWEDMLTTLCNCFAAAHSQDFEKCSGSMTT